MRNSPELPRNFRMTSNVLPDSINSQGLSDLHAAGGGQFSRASLGKILSKLHTRNLLVIDLRQESHGMLNGNAVSWYAKRNAGNAGKTTEEIEEYQAKLLAALGKEQVAVVNKILKKSSNGAIERSKPIEYMVHQTSTEKDLTTNAKLKYQHIYVQDFHAPSDKEVDRFLAIANSIPADQWVYFHCRAGVGRTTVFLTMYDILHNAKKVSLEDILARQIALGGKDLSKFPDKKHFKYSSAVERLNFIKKFYQYAQGNNDNYKTTWSQWVKR